MTRLKYLLDYLDYLDTCSDNQFLKFCDAMEKRGYQFVTQHVLDYDYPHVTHCKDCKHWAGNDGMFKDFDEREWHYCPHLGIDTDGYFSCIEGERKEE